MERDRERWSRVGLEGGVTRKRKGKRARRWNRGKGGGVMEKWKGRRQKGRIRKK